MKEKARQTWSIINEFYKSGVWFWLTVGIGVILLGLIIYLMIAYTIMLIWS